MADKINGISVKTAGSGIAVPVARAQAYRLKTTNAVTTAEFTTTRGSRINPKIRRENRPAAVRPRDSQTATTATPHSPATPSHAKAGHSIPPGTSSAQANATPVTANSAACPSTRSAATDCAARSRSPSWRVRIARLMSPATPPGSNMLPSCAM